MCGSILSEILQICLEADCPAESGRVAIRRSFDGDIESITSEMNRSCQRSSKAECIIPTIDEWDMGGGGKGEEEELGFPAVAIIRRGGGSRGGGRRSSKRDRSWLQDPLEYDLTGVQ